jgi:hypothetical protein
MDVAGKAYKNNASGVVVKVIDAFENIAILENKQKIDIRELTNTDLYTEELDVNNFLVKIVIIIWLIRLEVYLMIIYLMMVMRTMRLLVLMLETAMIPMMRLITKVLLLTLVKTTREKELKRSTELLITGEY